MSGNFQGLAMGVAGIMGGALVLIVGLNMSDIVISSINETGGRVGCYSSEGDVPIEGASYAPSFGITTAATVAGVATFTRDATAGVRLPTNGIINTTAHPDGASGIIDRLCAKSEIQYGELLQTIADGDATNPLTFAAGHYTSFATAVTNARDHGQVKYQLAVYGATGLNNIFSLLYFIVLVMIALGMVGGGAMIARDSVRGMSG